VRILNCYTNGKQSLKPQTYRALTKYCPIGQLEMINVGGHDHNYWREVSTRWKGEEDLVIIEQDNVLTAEVLPSFAGCEEPWCCYQYVADGPMLDGNVFTCHSIGCSRFSAALQRAIPIEVISDVPLKWDVIDQVLGRILRGNGFHPHVHGEVEHLHNYTISSADRAKVRQLVEVYDAKKLGGNL
jgi:hypothetical protein